MTRGAGQDAIASADVAIVGGAAAGLAAAAACQAEGLSAIILERHAQPGDKWRRRYDRLSLHGACRGGRAAPPKLGRGARAGQGG